MMMDIRRNDHFAGGDQFPQPFRLDISRSATLTISGVIIPDLAANI
jgi:hypothetical protein